jgi:hypothetical protein
MTDAEIRELAQRAGNSTELARLVEALTIERAATACQSQAIPTHLRETAYVKACDECAVSVLSLKHQVHASIVANEHRELLDDAARYRYLREHRHRNISGIRAALWFSGTGDEMDQDIDQLVDPRRQVLAR